MSSITKKYGAPYIYHIHGGGHTGGSEGYSLYEFTCNCGNVEINCPCIKHKKYLGDKTSEEFEKLKLPTHGERIIIEG